MSDTIEQLEPYDAGYLSSYGEGNVEWWHAYMRAELERARTHYELQFGKMLTGKDAPPAPAVTPVWHVHATTQAAAGETRHFDGLFVGEVATLEGYRDLRASVAKSLGQNAADAVVICNLSRVGEQG